MSKSVAIEKSDSVLTAKSHGAIIKLNGCSVMLRRQAVLQIVMLEFASHLTEQLQGKQAY